MSTPAVTPEDAAGANVAPPAPALPAPGLAGVASGHGRSAVDDDSVVAAAAYAAQALNFVAGLMHEGPVAGPDRAEQRLLGGLWHGAGWQFAATRRFRPASTAKVLQAVVGLTVQTALVALLGFDGMFAGVVAATLVVLRPAALAGVTLGCWVAAMALSRSSLAPFVYFEF